MTEPGHPTETPDADGQVDALLAADGARWRATQPAAPAPDPARLTAPRRSRWQPLAAAAAVVAVAAGGVAGVAVSRRGADSAPAGRVAGQTVTPADGIVQDGDRVVGQGIVVAPPGRPVQLCAPSGGVSVAIYPPPVPQPCEVAVTVTGLDLDRLSGRQARGGTVWGTARVEGTYRDRTLAVTRQEAYQNPPKPDASAPDEVGCAEPSGGWTRQPAGIESAMRRLSAAIGRRPAVYTDPQVRYPYGWHLQDDSDRKGTEVIVVGTTGDLDAARQELAAVFPAEHLCVIEVRWSKADMAAAERALSTPEARRAGIGRPFPDVLNDRVQAEVLVLDQAAADFLATVAGGRVVADPVLREAG